MPIPIMALRAVVVGNPEPTHYCPWLPQKQNHKLSGHHWLCCWRAEGAGDKMSAHSRSVPWPQVQEFYRRLQLLQPQSSIVDITNWKDWEASGLKAMGVNVLDPTQGTLMDLAQRCRDGRVVTIDTALVHLCAAAGQPASDTASRAFFVWWWWWGGVRAVHWLRAGPRSAPIGPRPPLVAPRWRQRKPISPSTRLGPVHGRKWNLFLPCLVHRRYAVDHGHRPSP